MSMRKARTIDVNARKKSVASTMTQIGDDGTTLGAASLAAKVALIAEIADAMAAQLGQMASLRTVATMMRSTASPEDLVTMIIVGTVIDIVTRTATMDADTTIDLDLPAPHAMLKRVVPTREALKNAQRDIRKTTPKLACAVAVALQSGIADLMIIL